MAVRLNVNAQVTGANQINQLNRSVQNLGRGAGVAATRFGGLEAAAARGRASFQALSTTLNVGLVAGFAAVGFGIQRFVRDTFEAGNLIEGLEIRFRLLFGSVEEGGRAFDTLNEFAARVPFSLEDIAAASGNLAVVSDDADDLSNILEITGNVAAATGLSFRQTAEQIQRSFAGGIASADVFRERGVRAMLGFQAGVTVSVDETIARFNEVFGPDGEFGQATGLLANTLQGQVSLVQDAYFQFRRVVSEQFFDALTDQIRALVGDFQTNSALLERYARRAGEAIGNAIQNIDEAIRFVIRNFDRLRSGIEAIIAFRLAGIFGGIAAAAVSLGVALTGTTTAAVGLNAALRANPVGALITVVQLAVAGLVFFREELTLIADRTIRFFNDQIDNVVDTVIRLVRQLNRIPGINIELETSTEKAARAAETLRANYSSLHDEVATGAASLNELAAAQIRVNTAQAEAAAIAENRQSIRDAAAANTMRAAEELRNQIEINQALLARDRITGELSDSERDILRLKTEILQHEMMTGEVISQTAEKLLETRAINEELSKVTQENLNDFEGINETVDQGLTLLERRAEFLRQNAAETRRLFQETVRVAEAEEMAARFREAADNQDRGRLAGREPTISDEDLQDAIERIMRIDMAWETVHQTLGEIGETVGNDIVDAIVNGEDAMESLRNTARSVLSDIARQLASSGFSQLLQGGLSSARGGAGGGFLSGIAGTVGGFLGFNQGGIVPGSGITDSVPALLTPGERVIPRGQANSVGNTNITNINISGNVDQRSIDQIKSVIASSSSEVGQANSQFRQNTRGLRGRNR